MNHLQTRKTVQTALLVTLIGLSLACGYSAKTTPPVAGNVPAITALAPNNMAAGGAAFTLTVNGTTFNSDAVVNWGGVAQTSHFVSATQVTADIPATAIATSATVKVTVTNPGKPGTGQYGSGGTLPETSNSMDFTIN
jgi:phage baseplate assembly protein gpV